jgi:Arc/MetJ-type ribon-helix-helix transcriptional regulator
MATQIITLSLPEELVQEIDLAAKGRYANRSEYIRQAVVGRLRSEGVDAWSMLAAGADEIRAAAQRAGYQTDADYARAVSELRQKNER